MSTSRVKRGSARVDTASPPISAQGAPAPSMSRTSRARVARTSLVIKPHQASGSTGHRDGHRTPHPGAHAAKRGWQHQVAHRPSLGVHAGALRASSADQPRTSPRRCASDLQRSPPSRGLSCHHPFRCPPSLVSTRRPRARSSFPLRACQIATMRHLPRGRSGGCGVPSSERGLTPTGSDCRMSASAGFSMEVNR